MKKIQLLVPFVLIFMGACSFNSLKSDQLEWQSFTSEKAEFSVDFPVKPVEQFNNMSTPAGNVTFRSHTSSVKESGIMLVVGSGKFPVPFDPSKKEQAYENVIKQTIPGSGLKVGRITDIELGDIEGKEIEVYNGSLNGAYRIYIKGQMFYQLVAINDRPFLDATEIEKIKSRFLDSFRLLEDDDEVIEIDSEQKADQ